MPNNKILDHIIELMQLEQLEVHLFRGQSQDMDSGNVFGGQVLGQGLIAAYNTVEADHYAHSMHGYFLRSGNIKSPIVYDVDRIRDGKSFTTRRIRAIQYGEAIFNMSVSFHKIEKGFEHQIEPEDIGSPDGLLDEVELRARHMEKVPEKVRNRALRDRPFDMRPVHQEDYMMPKKSPPHKRMWMRAKGDLPKDLASTSLHQALIAYASDMGLMSTSTLPHGITYLSRGFQGASLDHSMWFHRPFAADEWLLYETDSPIALGARGFNRGAMYRQNGELVVSTTQEALIRQWPAKPKSKPSN